MLGLLVLCLVFLWAYLYGMLSIFMQHILDVQSCQIQAVLDWFESAMKFWHHSLLGASCQRARSA